MEPLVRELLDRSHLARRGHRRSDRGRWWAVWYRYRMDSHERLASLWPASGVRIRVGDMELRWIDDDLLADLAVLAGRGVHDEQAMPFNIPWTRGSSTEVARRVLAFHWNARTEVSPTGKLTLDLGVLVNGVPAGIQGASGTDWRVCRSVETGSWLGREFQGRGIGTRMRVAIAWAFFHGLGAERMTSAAFVDNPASAAVSRHVGYAEDGTQVVNREGKAATQVRFLLTKDRWNQLQPRHAALLGAPVELSGFDDLRAHLS
jgi:RimJ/RimL family protein N-acetyltransferase